MSCKDPAFPSTSTANPGHETSSAHYQDVEECWEQRKCETMQGNGPLGLESMPAGLRSHLAIN